MTERQNGVESLGILRNRTFEIKLTGRGAVSSVVLLEDPARMNWVVDPAYLAETGFPDEDKLFGEWSMTVDGTAYASRDAVPRIRIDGGRRADIAFAGAPVDVAMSYSLETEGRLDWRIAVRNRSAETVRITGLHVWFSLAHVMFRDLNVFRNMRHSCAVFPHLGGDFAKFAAIRRSHEPPHLGIYGTGGRAATLGTFCRYQNRFLEQVSPSLDGLLFHRLSLVENGDSFPELAATDWIYGDQYRELALAPGESGEWRFVFVPCKDEADFYRQALAVGHPRWTYTPALTAGGVFEAELELPAGRSIREVRLSTWSSAAGRIETEVVTGRVSSNGAGNVFRLALRPERPGERKLELVLDDGRTDVLVWNVLEPIGRMLERRAEWLCRNSYDPSGAHGRPHAFLPLSNQGESLGKLAFILMKNLLTKPNPEQVRKVEAAAALDVKHHWFEGGDFRKPRPLYGTFYRVYDFDYIAHVYYLLSRMDRRTLELHPPETYLRWAADVLSFRLDPDGHSGEREKNEARLNGVFILYIQDLLRDLALAGLTGPHRRLERLWQEFSAHLAEETRGFRGAITEHYYDNAGFGPTCDALCRIGLKEEARAYGELILANIGFSNDYRVQNPDRWWEALSSMIHSLWGGLVAASARSAYEHLGDPALLLAAYRATMAMFNCYDWHVASTPRRLEPGEAASTFSIAAPNLNMPVLSRNRFGQSVFREAGDPLFKRLFANSSGDDWDMGEELVAYLLGFGTTAYLYRDADGVLRCVNGYAEQGADGWNVMSYAAYPRRYVCLEDGAEFVADDGEEVRWIQYRKGRFERVSTPDRLPNR